MQTLDKTTLEMAIIGYQQEVKKIDAKIRELRRQLQGYQPGPFLVKSEPAPTQQRVRTMSAAAKRRIAAAQKKRWAAWHAAQAKKQSASKPKSHPRRTKHRFAA